ncbi:uncharacterized protein EpC_11690 [Erwinia pyrifoliae Ep1/96]|nr:uncharacterized protein EpC_11690 [Erwinia pyrifoliae Ep1/96]
MRVPTIVITVIIATIATHAMIRPGNNTATWHKNHRDNSDCFNETRHDDSPVLIYWLQGNVRNMEERCRECRGCPSGYCKLIH